MLVLVVSILCYVCSAIIDYKVVALLLLVTLSLLALFFDIFPVLIAAILSVLIWNFFFIPPRLTFRVATSEDFLLLVAYFIIVMLHALFTIKIRLIEKESRKKEEKASNLKLYNTLLNSLSHELRTPIASIIGASDNLLMNAGKLTEENKFNLLTVISVASLRLNQQVENLLSMSRLESGTIQIKKDWCDVTEMVYEVIKRLEENLREHNIQIQIKENLPLFKIDMGLIEQVLYNLVYNAIIYTQPTANIIIKVDGADDRCIIIVEDNGKGFPPSEIEKVFDKFYRLKNSRTGGTGLGLSIARGFVEAHQGSISLENIITGGARFTINIPAETTYLRSEE